MLPYAAIDPLALILPTRWYLILVEKLHPNEPVISAIKAIVPELNAEEKVALVANAKRLVEYGNAVLAVAQNR